MVQLHILSGPKAGDLQVVRRFPFRVGRTDDNDLALDAPGVWDHHFKLDLRAGEGVALHALDEAFAAVNDERRTQAPLRNGDVISFGSVKVQFWLAPPVQRGLRYREWFVWFLVAAVTVGQGALVYWLLLN